MRGAADRISVAIALQEIAPRHGRLRLVDVEFRRKFRIARLQRRMHEIAADHRGVPASAEGEGDMSRRMAGRRQDARMVADLDPNTGDVFLDGVSRGSMPAPSWLPSRRGRAASPAFVVPMESSASGSSRSC